ncbi:MAG: hypothetical protein PF485_06670 [Bacteroidales bacterium]|jgi:hypothetical protein|nr:hypothetical protein [Bacteroidales bacterium]
MLNKITISLLFISFNYSLIAQVDNNFEFIIKDYMELVQKEVYSPSLSKDFFNKNNPEDILITLNGYYNDTLAKVRFKAFYLTYKTAYKSNSKNLREEAVFRLVQGLKDEESGNVGSIANWLTNFNTSDFNEEAKDSLKWVLREQKSYLDKIIRIVAFVGLSDQIEYLKNNLQNGIYSSNKVVWAVHLAMARLGVQEEIDFCVELVKKQKLNDDVVYELLPDLVYIRDKKAINYLVEILNDETKNCYSANPENPKQIVCGYRVMEYLAPIIKDFPLEYDDTGDLLVEDYEQALIITRNWFKENSDNYSLIKYTY